MTKDKLIAIARYMIIGLCCTLGIAQASPENADFYVATNGADTNPGTIDFPFATLGQARQAVRQKIGVGLTTNILVLIRGGTYELTEPLVFEPPDSGNQQFSISYEAYPGEEAIISGGHKITGWHTEDNRIWTVAIPDVAAGRQYFRDFYIDGSRAVRARSPSANNKAHPYYQLVDSTLSPGNKSWVLKLKPGEVNNWKNLNDVEVVMLSMWSIKRKLVLSVDPALNTITLKPPHLNMDWFIMPQGGWYFYLENARAFLDGPGQWYLDRQTGVLSYWPQPDEDMTKADANIPRTGALLEVRGRDDKPVQNLHFRGLHFADTDWSLPEPGYIETQAGHYQTTDNTNPHWQRISEAVMFEFAKRCSLENCEIAHLGQSGIGLRRGCSGDLIKGNRLWDIAANGINVGESQDSSTVTMSCSDNLIMNNEIADCGINDYGCVGVWVGFANGTVIAHNLIHDLPYTGISVGWKWNPEPTSCRNNLVEANHIFNVMKKLADGGGIYTLGSQPGTLLRENLIHNVLRAETAGGGPNNGIFFDQGSHDIVCENNVIYQTAMGPFRINDMNHDTSVIIRNNFTDENIFWKGKVGTYALKTTDDHYLEVPHAVILEPTNLTIEAWIRPLGFQTGNEAGAWLVCKNSNELTDGNYALVISHNNLGAYLNIGGGRENQFAAWTRNGPLTSNGWSHAAMTFDGHDLKVYCNGNLAASAPVNCVRTFGNGVLRIGKRADGFNPSFNGLLDDVRLYNRALSPEEIAAHYAQPAPAISPPSNAPPASLIAHWDFTEMHNQIGAIKASAGPEEPYRTRFALLHADAARRTATETNLTSSQAARAP